MGIERFKWCSGICVSTFQQSLNEESVKKAFGERKRLPFARANHFHCMLPLRDLILCDHSRCSSENAVLNNVKYSIQRLVSRDSQWK